MRSAAAQAVHSFGSAASAPLFDLMHHGTFHAREGALVALPAGEAAQATALRDVARAEIMRLKQSRDLAAAIPTAGAATQAATRLMRETLLDHMHQQTRLAVQVIGRLGRSARQGQTDFALIGQNLFSNDAELRAAAIEALESLGDRDLSKELITLLDAPVEQTGQPAFTPAQAIAQLLNGGDMWLRALAVRASADVHLDELSPIIRTLVDDPDPLVRDAAHEVLLAQGEKMSSLHTASLMERILLLREVALFAGLSPEDLKQIAEVTREQRFADSAIVCRQGEPGHELFLVVEGKLQVIKQMGSEQKLIATLGPGECVGEMAIFESLARYATVIAEGEAFTLVLDGDVFKSILHDRPDVALAVLRTLSQRLRNLN